MAGVALFAAVPALSACANNAVTERPGPGSSVVAVAPSSPASTPSQTPTNFDFLPTLNGAEIDEGFQLHYGMTPEAERAVNAEKGITEFSKLSATERTKLATGMATYRKAYDEIRYQYPHSQEELELYRQTFASDSSPQKMVQELTSWMLYSAAATADHTIKFPRNGIAGDSDLSASPKILIGVTYPDLASISGGASSYGMAKDITDTSFLFAPKYANKALSPNGVSDKKGAKADMYYSNYIFDSYEKVEERLEGNDITGYKIDYRIVGSDLTFSTKIFAFPTTDEYGKPIYIPLRSEVIVEK